MIKVDLPSGAKLEITISPFAQAKTLYQSVMEECKGIKLGSSSDLGDLIKDLFCIGLSSKKIEAALMDCLKRVTYNGLKISDDTFEPEDARQDYIHVNYEVAKANLQPFMKNLYAQYRAIMAILTSGQA